MYFGFVVGTLLILMSAGSELMLRTAKRTDRIAALAPGLGGVAMMIGAATKIRRDRATMSLRSLVFRTTALVVVAVVIQVPSSRLTADVISQLMISAGLRHAHIGALMPLTLSMLLVHTAAAIVIPWTLREAARPVLIIAALAALASPFAPDPWPERFGGILVIVLMGCPGMLICALRSSRFREVVERRFLLGRYSEVQRELQYARRIHEQLFPQPITSGPLRFAYRYEPMRQIGGDFVDVIRERDGRMLTIVLVDVTGHGIAAALAVNRLQGEVKRVLARGDNVSPGDVIRALNEYVNLTLAEQSIFATAMVIRINSETHTLTWASAGHPPAFLVRASGAIERLDSTAMMLGPLDNSDYVIDDALKPFEMNDMLIAYTDGAIECRDAKDRELGIKGLEEITRESAGENINHTLDRIAARVNQFRHGPTEDDTVLLAVLATEDQK